MAELESKIYSKTKGMTDAHHHHDDKKENNIDSDDSQIKIGQELSKTTEEKPMSPAEVHNHNHFRYKYLDMGDIVHIMIDKHIPPEGKFDKL